MPFYKYKAVSGAGEVQEGVLEAASTSAAVARVQSMGLIPIRAEEALAAGAAAPAARARSALFQRKTVSQNDIGTATRELATLLRAGLPLDRSFEILINLSGNPKLASCSRTFATRCAAVPRSRRRSTTRRASSRAST
jgi:general secretion pathway protein F